MTNEQLIERGAYLVNIMDCNVCHSPKVLTDKGPAPDPERMLSGHPANMPLLPYDTVTAAGYVLAGQMLTVWIGPWGVSYAANLTPHESGLGNWTEEALHRGIPQWKTPRIGQSATHYAPHAGCCDRRTAR
jgi:hypothetical protein